MNNCLNRKRFTFVNVVKVANITQLHQLENVAVCEVEDAHLFQPFCKP